MGSNGQNLLSRVAQRAGLIARAGSAAGAPSRSRGFTLIEVIVAVGAIAVISVGIASILNAVGKTVTGGRRTSNLTQYAALVEAQMRADFESMTRDGFLVIRNQVPDLDADTHVSAADNVPLYDEDLSPRPRRTDEIIFFMRNATASGETLEPQSTTRRAFASQRQAMDPTLTVSSNVARVYYGHGARARTTTTNGAFQYGPTLVGQLNDQADAQLGVDAPGNPNLFASQWTLLRQVVVLAPERSTAGNSATTALFGLDPTTPAGRRRLSDKDTQVALQPAAASLFRAFNRVLPDQLNQQDLFRTLAGGGQPQDNRPQLGSGLVDIATTSLEEIRSVVTTCPLGPLDITAASDCVPWQPTVAGIYPDLNSGDYPPPGDAAAASLDRQFMWMRDAFPAPSIGADCEDLFTGGAGSSSGQEPAPMSRLRYELEPKDLLPVFAQPAANADEERERAIARADQLMLTSPNFVPRCSEFIVEWTFGQIDEGGQMIWHGLWRRADLDGNGTVDPDEWVTRPYPLDRDDNLVFARRPVAVNLAIPVAAGEDEDLPAPFDVVQRVPTRLIHGLPDVADPAFEPLSVLDSYFGYDDPTLPRDFSRLLAGGPTTPDDANGDGDLFNDFGDLIQTGDVGKWPWPKLIRVTITLADPQDPKIESTFQYIFTTPSN